VIWETPTSDGGKPIKKYLIEYAGCDPTKHGCHFKTVTVGAKHHRATVSGLHHGSHYRIVVRARSHAGVGKPSRVMKVTV
jgi:hypothetical protein